MNKKAGFVTIIGKPNTGKSTLVNTLIDFKLSVVNKKAQTTRNKISGILTGKDYQIVFLDTPGIIEPKYELQNFMLFEIVSSLEEADLIILLLDAVKPDLESFISFKNKFKSNLEDKVILIVLNKIDLLKKNELLPVIQLISEKLKGSEIIPVSALKDENIDTLKQIIIANLSEGGFFYDENSVTDKTEKFITGEIIREQILTLYHEEIPYSCFVKVTEFKERNEKLISISAEIILERESQKAILIGKNGESLKRLGERARKKLESFLGKKVYLSLFVKIRKDWRKAKDYIKKNLYQ